MDVSRERTVECGEVMPKTSAEIKEKNVLYYLLSALWGFVTGIGALPFSAVPFGFAAAAVSSRYIFGVIAGLVASCVVSRDGYELLGAYGVTFVCRAAFSVFSKNGERVWERLFCERLSLRMVSAATGALALGVVRLVSSGFLYYHVIGTVVTMTLSAVLVFFWYSVVPKKSGERKIKGRVRRIAATCSMAALTVYAFSGMNIFGVSLSVFFALTLTLFAVRRGGISYGVLISICTGVFISATYAPLFILAAVCFAVLHRVSLGLACFSSLAAGVAWGIYMTGIVAVSELFPGLFAASVIFTVLDKLFFSEAENKESTSVMDKPLEGQSAQDLASADAAFTRLDDISYKVQRLCVALSSLSEKLVLTELKYRNRYATSKNAQMGGSVSANICGAEVAVKRRVAKRNIKAKRQKNEELVELAEIFEPSAEIGRTESAAAEISMISDYLAAVMREAQSEYFVNENMSRELCAKFADIFGQNECLRVSVLEGDAERICVSAENQKTLEIDREKILSVVSETMGMPFTCGDIAELEKRYCLLLYPKPMLTAYAAGRSKNAPAEKDFCGDSFDVLRSEGGVMHAYISDGMGSGKAAARTSELSSVFLRELLPLGVGTREVLKVLNGFLRSLNCTSAAECAAGTDIVRIDLSHGKARFYKSGAAPTYVFRDGELIKLTAHTLPIGIMNETDVAEYEIDVLAGDVIVMVSDGVTEGREECPELFEFVRSRLLTHTVDQLAEAIIGYTQKRGCQDDATVVVIRIEQESLAA